MSDLISRQAAIEETWKEPSYTDPLNVLAELRDRIKDLPSAQPTVDAVPVIRCKDCQYWMKNPYRESSVFGLCFKHKDIAIATDETDWCSWAERKEE